MHRLKQLRFICSSKSAVNVSRCLRCLHAVFLTILFWIPCWEAVRRKSYDLVSPPCKSEIGQDCRCTTGLTSVESVTCFPLASEPNPKEEKYSPPRKNPQRAYINGYSADLTLAVCNSLINQLLQRLCLFLGGYRTDNRIAYDVAVLVNNICCWIRVQSGGEFPGLAF